LVVEISAAPNVIDVFDCLAFSLSELARRSESELFQLLSHLINLSVSAIDKLEVLG
jgi:hypothetical protein